MEVKEMRMEEEKERSVWEFKLRINWIVLLFRLENFTAMSWVDTKLVLNN